MFINHRRDGDIWERAMERDNVAAWAALVFGALDCRDIPAEDDDEPLDNRTWGCNHGPDEDCRNCDTPDPWNEEFA
jgi:hypothetical protein